MNILILNWRDPKNPKSGGAEQVTMEHAKAWVKKALTKANPKVMFRSELMERKSG